MDEDISVRSTDMTDPETGRPEVQTDAPFRTMVILALECSVRR